MFPYDAADNERNKSLKTPTINETEYNQSRQNIQVHVTQSREYPDTEQNSNKLAHSAHRNPSNITTIHRSNKAVQALNLPTVININPRSLNNKSESFKTYMEEEGVDLALISESHEQEHKPLVESLNMKDFEIISSLHQRRGKGGQPAIVVNKVKYVVQNVTNTLINIPWGVEAVWAVLTPRKLTHDSTIQRIAVCSFYNKNKRSKFKTALLKHIAEAFNILSIKYTKGLHFILGADANHLKLDTILSLRSDLRCVVEDYTRLGPPPAMLDPLITTLGSYYQRPVCYPPLDADVGSGGVKSDHLIVKMVPVNIIDNKSARSFWKVTVRPMSEVALRNYDVVMQNHDWSNVFAAQSTHEKASILQAEHVNIVENCFHKE